MGLMRRRVPAWSVVAAAMLAAAVAAGGLAVAGGGTGGIEAMRAQLPELTRAGAGDAAAPTVTRKAGLKFRYVAAAFDNPAGEQTVAGVRCPRRTLAVGGGVLSSSRAPGTQAVNSSLPLDGRDNNERNDDGWVAAVDNLTLTSDLQFGVYAICRRK